MKNRAPRIVLCKLHNTALILDGKTYALANISSSGLGIHLDSGDSEHFKAGLELAIKLQFENKLAHDLRIKIIHRGEHFVGAQILNPSERFGSELSEYFARELEIKKMKEVPKELVKQSAEGDMHWFNGGDECDLVYVYKDGIIVRFEIHFYGNIIQGGKKLKTVYAQVQSPSDRFQHYDGSQLLTGAKGANDLTKNLIKNFLDNLENLPTEHKGLIYQLL